MRSWMIAFSLGIWLSTLLPVLPPFNTLYLLFGATLLLCLARSIPLFGAYCFGLAWGIFHLQAASAELLPKHLENSELWVRGEIRGLIQQTPDSKRFILAANSYCTETDITACETHWKDWPVKIRLNDFHQLPIHTGNSYTLLVKLKQPHGFANPWTFDYEAWLWEQGIRATGYTLNVLPVAIQQTGYFSLPVTSLQSRLNQQIDSIADNELIRGGYTQLAVIRALTVGNRYNISDNQWTLFEQTGTTHLMVISGLHVGLVAWLCAQLAGWCWSRSVTLMYRLPAQRFAALAGIAGALCYCSIAGYSLPAVRATIMISLLLFCQLCLHQTRAINSLCLALGIILFMNPMAPVTTGFWLSFGAVALLLFFMNRKQSAEDEIEIPEPENRHVFRTFYHRWLLPGFRAQWLLFIGMLPLMAVLLGRVSLLAPVINLFAVPLIGMIIVPLCLGSLLLSFLFPSLAALILLLADFLLDGYQRLIFLLTGFLPVSALSLPAPPVWALITVVTACLTILIVRHPLWRSLALTGFLPLFLIRSPVPNLEARFHVLDVGQGLAVLIETRHHLVIYDSGPAYSDRFNAGGGLLAPYIMRGGLPRPDILIISHGDSDHAGGMGSLLQVYPGMRIYSGEPDRLAVNGTTPCQSQLWSLDGVEFSFLETDGPRNNSNNHSCILVVSTGEHQVLLPGDIDKEVEAALLTSHRDKLSSGVLLAPHHGSLSSSSTGFINFTRPQWVIFSNGYLNRYSHPHPTVVSRYHNRDIVTLQTAEEGAIRFNLNADGISAPESWRRTNSRIWR